MKYCTQEKRMSAEIVVQQARTEVIEQREITPLQLIQDSLNKNVAPEVLRELMSLQQSMVRFKWEAEERQAKKDFDDALTSCQSQIGRIAPNQHRHDTNSNWADYSQLDRAIRPIYTAQGFNLSFSEAAPIVPGKVHTEATLSRAGISRHYHNEIMPSTVGLKGGVMATATDADAIASSRNKRYLLLAIFNIAIGIDALEKEGIPDDQVEPYLKAIRTAPDSKALDKVYLAAKKAAVDANDHQALRIFTEAGALRRKELNHA
jgi:hypothetical protein